MKLAAILLLVTVSTFLVISQALDDDEEDQDQKYTVSFFQFNPRDLTIGGGHRKEPSKKNFKRSDADTLPKPVNNTTTNTTIGSTNNAAATAKLSNESSVKTNNTRASIGNVNTTAIANGSTGMVNGSAEIVNGSAVKVDNSTELKALNKSTGNPSTRDSDINIMNTLINMAMRKNLTASPKDVHNDNTTDTVGSINVSGNFIAQNTSILNPRFDINFTKDDNSSTNASTKITIPVVKAIKKDVLAAPYRKDLLNPNPKPSEDEAMLNLKDPKQLENQPHDPLIHSDNTSSVEETPEKVGVTTNTVTMEKNENKEDNNGEVEASNEEPEIAGKDAQNTTESLSSSNTTAEEDEKKKIAKDKQTNKEIKENAKEIQDIDINPIKDIVGNVNNSMNDKVKSAAKTKHESPARSKVDHLNADKTKHRNNVAKFVPLYKMSAKDHKLSFQIGSMKHPKHNIHPKCHACPLNSTYKECVRKSTLLECSKGLNNICFTKSTKKKGIITYQMGCANHNKCVSAKAFPCKDGREHCFTCCQYDRCNSSPHHGDYELDELNLDELSGSASSRDNKDTTKFDSTSAIDKISGSWMAYASTIIVVLLLHL